MKHGIVSSGNKAFFTATAHSASPLISTQEESETIRIWKETLQSLGFDTDDHGIGPGLLFELIKEAFDKRFGKKPSISFEQKYIASVDGEFPVPHNDSSRIFSSNDFIYCDDLMVSVLFEYVATYYIWARYEAYDENVFSFCFPYALNTLNYCCRQGYLNSDENKAELSKALKKYCDDVAVEFIADLYWSILAFTFCHELAHIYLGHTNGQRDETEEQLWQEELAADEIGYSVYLDILSGELKAEDSPFLSVFHDYLYVAPMILFLFYGDLYYMDYWLFGEAVKNDGHPPLEMRIQRLLEISEREQYTFATAEGNDVLNSFWDTSDKFRVEVFYKLMNGKLEEVSRKGKFRMDNSSYKEAAEFDNRMREEMREMAEEYGLSPEKMIGLYDIAARVEVQEDDSLMHFVWNHNNSAYSSKPYNFIFRLKAVLFAIIENGLSFSVPDNKIQTIMLALRILLQLGKFSTVQITEDQAKVLVECHNLGAYRRPIEEEVLLERMNISRNTIDELCKLKCIELRDGKIWLIEEIWL